ncbi:MAG: hypothetical protein ACK4IW_01930, partial [Brevundimonas aurantiaca]
LQIQDQGLKTTKNHRKENQEAFLLTVRRFDWSAEPIETNPRKQEVFQPLNSPRKPGSRNSQALKGRPVSERGSPIRAAILHRNRILKVR